MTTEPTLAVTPQHTPRPITHVLTIPVSLADPNDSDARLILNRAVTGILLAAAANDLVPAFIGQATATAVDVGEGREVFTLVRVPTGEAQAFTSTLDGLDRALGGLQFREEPGAILPDIHVLFSLRTQLAAQIRAGATEARAGLWALQRGAREARE